MKKSVPIIVILGCVAIFIFGIAQLFQLRFESGDVYPIYSSLRSDPLGTMAFYESIDKLPGISTERDFSADNRLPQGPHTTYLHLAADTSEWDEMPEDVFQTVDTFVKSGGRLVITLLPESAYEFNLYDRNYSWTNSQPSGTNSQPAQKTNPKNPKPIKPKKLRNPPDDEDPYSKSVSVEDRWGFDFALIDLNKDDNDVYVPARVRNQTDLPLPHALDWHSGVIFTNLDAAWRPIYTRGTNAVVIERKFGNGSVVIATDTYFVSNEAMLKDRHADFLAWLVGPAKTVVFDEAHLGVVETTGVAGLMRKYRLYWLVGGLILLAVLFIWKNSMSLLPPHVDETRNGYLAGKEAASGFVNLLRRNILSRDLLETCFTEWKKSAQGGKYSSARVQQAELIFLAENSVPAGERNPFQAYQDISAALNTKRNPKPTTKA